ncbi:GDSL esterase/lipase At5g45960-like [Rutidosis leptorrhynchoides]|uniref:GDSL esterase/lipase At5g45960-like n=1 Tax=Rutidosis leptorrhynchoides TaxID=125765 RepID=UPI003A98FB15
MSTTISFHLVMLVIINILYMQYCYCYANNNKKSKISSLFAFGDSTVDPGNNNYIPTIMRGNFPPYGKDFDNHVATGRFTNGRLVTDLVAEYAGLKKNVPPYLKPNITIQDLMTGVSFASSGGGFDPFTPLMTGAIPQSQQLEMFKEYKSKLEAKIGKKRTKTLVRNAGFLISAGTNDIAFNYYGPILVQRTNYPNVLDYQHFIGQNVNKFLQGLLNEGASTIGIAGLPPIGCLPAMITLYSTNPNSNRRCINYLNSISIKYNHMLQKNIKGLQRPGVKIVYFDIFNPIMDMVNQKAKYGFNEVNRGCCGDGYIGAALMCANAPVCNDTSKYIFWDSVHPSEKAYRLVFDSLLPSIETIIS